MRDEGAVGCLNDGVVCGVDEIFGGGGIDLESVAESGGAFFASGESSEKEGVVAAFDESREKEGTAIEGAAGVACGVFWSSLSSSSILTSGSALTTVFSSLILCLSRLFILSPCFSSVALMSFESGGGRRVHDRRHVFGGCRCIRNVKDRIKMDMPQTAIRNYLFVLTCDRY
jgi:hypothetical protein